MPLRTFDGIAVETPHARIPGSKSLTNRALLLAAAAEGTTVLSAPLVSEDTIAFRGALEQLGVRVSAEPGDGHWHVRGLGGGPLGDARVHCGDAGTAARFLPPFTATGQGLFYFDGSLQLRARPMRPLIDALTRLGVTVHVGRGGRLPLVVEGGGLQGGRIVLDSDLSSQYLSGLLMAAPLLSRPLTIDVPHLVSRPYVDMTLALMRHFGAHVERSGNRITTRPGGYVARDLPVEPDASSASYFFAAAAATGRSVTVRGLGRHSLQGDLGFARVLRLAGAEVTVGDNETTVRGPDSLRGGFTIDMGDISDTFMTLAAVAPLADAPITITGIAHTRLKESDRISAVARNLRACGILVEEDADRITVHPGVPRPTTIACYRDHRIAMSFAVLNLASSAGFALDDPACVDKTFPGFHAELRRLMSNPVVPTDSEEHR
ncbi:3-phosphoshikimate 1-carboxyvinyltransferase [Streptomyces montanus]|uniref:3-phosphoshikimate 1-carboxyvinyltransferase n=1 Tax=Streptomyces montanus TaxID=2580423 RepID=A0A5R9FNU4_9ACTN|nr:3-phosphoshikimate 1-carboxyvinyltransferase [Streptomyces montanus]TLS43786.1 3-phosphoshikimate 1-carboxyvinyltransferase [Streptomyces montanus]